MERAVKPKKRRNSVLTVGIAPAKIVRFFLTNPRYFYVFINFITFPRKRKPSQAMPRKHGENLSNGGFSFINNRLILRHR